MQGRTFLYVEQNDLMKRLLVMVFAALMLLSMMACGGKVDAVDATDEQKQAVIKAAQECLNSEIFLVYVDAYEKGTGEMAKKPEITVAFTFQSDVEGYDMDLILFEAKASCLIEEESTIYDRVQFAVDNKTGKIYDSISYRQLLNNFDGVVDSEEKAILMLMNIDFNTKNYLWSETETSTKFTGSDLKEINAAIQ